MSRYRTSIIVEVRPLEALDCPGVATNCSIFEPGARSGKLSDLFINALSRALARANERLREKLDLERRQSTLFGTGG